MKRKHRTGIKIVAALAVLSGSGLLAAILFLCRGEWLPGLLLFCTTAIPSAGLLIWLIFPLLRISKRIAGTGIHPDLTQAGIPADPFEMLLYDNWVDAAARFKQNLEEEYDNREIASQIKFSMLQYQINPHFLYNTLDSVRGLAYAEGADSAAEMAEALAAFFRYSISHSDDIVSLGKELNNIKRYFVIQGYRFSKRFSLVVDISEDDIAIWGYPIPKLMIQPLVENAVFHGLEKKSGKGSVTISTSRTQRRLYLYVVDDGVGMSQEKMREINRAIYAETNSSPAGSSGGGTGIALRNINRRIQYLYGKEFGLNLESTEGFGTQIEIALPWPPPKEMEKQ